MKIAVVKEVEVGERRVALIPDTVARLVKQGLEVWVEAGAGDRAYFTDAAYEAAGAKVFTDTETVWREADILVKVAPLQERGDGRHEADLLHDGQVVVGFLDPLGTPELAQRLAERRITAFSMEMIPRTTRAQS